MSVEVHLSNGLPSLSIVGLPETAVKESKDRVRSALINSNFEFPAKRITINLSPADLPKEGGRYDLPIAIGILVASEQVIATNIDGYEFAAELSLDGSCRSVSGILPFVLGSRAARRRAVVARPDLREANLINGVNVGGAAHLLDVCRELQNGGRLADPPAVRTDRVDSTLDMHDVIGQHAAKRAVEIAAAGGHNLLLVGPPGTGKSMLALRMPGILSTMNDREALETAAVLSISQQRINPETFRMRPVRMPHHSSSAAALVGGGSYPRPGEISLAHNGILFLDELPEFDRHVLEMLREPLESGKVVISRAARQAEFPARFQLLAAMNPCPCGHFGNPAGHCRCGSEQIRRYLNRLSGPFLDRIDLQVEVPAVSQEALLSGRQADGEDSATIKARVAAARTQQAARQCLNGQMNAEQLRTHCELNAESRSLLGNAIEKLGLSARGFHRILRVSRTIADLAGSDRVETRHVAEALGYRKLERLTESLP